ncbi:MAG TPA: NADH:flavin oxidoreductase [Cytophagales bacterium]|nr:NADH:flavin oxidoreductase [Cytophagales bacterium]HAA22953.1 NADH:flavin oxidoreductase [Cytophagales bacterium]HAP60183.1 NADH:flavin oxidoreductase [Cytophagales bacterium]
MTVNHLNAPLTLPCGVSLKNRLVKAAMTERISNRRMEPTEGHQELYRLWANTGAGLLITGNVIVDPVHAESAGNVYVGDDDILPKLKAWAEAAKQNDTHVWVQISHAGRQTNRFKTSRPLAPSPVQLQKMGLFGKPKAMTEVDIQGVIKNFVKAASLCQAAGFTGVQIHSAHGYLLSQFLSPITNQRTDAWGGSLENRCRLLLTIVEETRKAVGDKFPISVKLNSSDFQRGGFSEEESLQVIQWLEGKIDLLEVSGGTYENLVFFEKNEELAPQKESTRKREAYFMDFSKKVRAVSQIPLMITGGFRSFDFCNQALENKELDLVGMARPFITNIPDIPAFLAGDKNRLENLVVRTGIKSMNDTSEGGFYARQIVRLAAGKNLDLNMGAWNGSLFIVRHELRKAMLSRFG